MRRETWQSFISPLFISLKWQSFPPVNIVCGDVTMEGGAYTQRALPSVKWEHKAFYNDTRNAHTYTRTHTHTHTRARTHNKSMQKDWFPRWNKVVKYLNTFINIQESYDMGYHSRGNYDRKEERKVVVYLPLQRNFFFHKTQAKGDQDFFFCLFCWRTAVSKEKNTWAKESRAYIEFSLWLPLNKNFNVDLHVSIKSYIRCRTQYVDKRYAQIYNCWIMITIIIIIIIIITIHESLDLIHFWPIYGNIMSPAILFQLTRL